MKTSTLGKLLELPNFHHFYTVPIRENTESSGNYIIVFEQDKQPVFVDLKNEDWSHS
ncbi:hypothetical protein [Streptococcus suis]|uniref:hypothetical protein n=1 Tax=Streptococcus suis TaxID=1307 RepID=UPI003908B410